MREPSGRRTVAALAFALGAASVLGFSPFDFYPAMLASHAALVHLWLSAKTPRAAMATGFWFGLGFFGAGVSWIYVSLERFGGMPPVLAAIATLAFCSVLASYPALVGWLQQRLRAGEALRAAIVIPALWTLAEWTRGALFTGFPWLSSGYATLGTPLEAIAPLTGTYGLTLVTMSCAGLLWCIVRGRSRRVALATLASLVLGALALRTVEWSVPIGAPLSVSVLQGNVPQAFKFDPARYARTLRTYEQLAERSQARLIVLPETAVPRFLDSIDPAYLARLERIARQRGADLLLGVPLRLAPGTYYNGAVSYGVSPIQHYRKRHLVPFGEFVPPGFGWIGSVLSIPMSDFSRGSERQQPLALAGLRVAVNICYEDAYGAEIISQLPMANLLVNVSNVAWFGDSLAPAQHLQIARMRALETGRAHVTATNTGISAAIDRDGRVLGRLPQFTTDLLTVRVQGYAGATPYVRFGDIPALAVCLLLLAVPAIVAWFARKR